MGVSRRVSRLLMASPILRIAKVRTSLTLFVQLRGGKAMPKRFATRRAVSSRCAVIARAESRASCSTAGGAVSGVPLLNGGSGAYSMCSWMSWATSSPRRSAATRSAPSIPAVTPAAKTIFPSLTTRSFTGVAPKHGSRCKAVQWVVAWRPLSSPVAPQINASEETVPGDR